MSENHNDHIVLSEKNLLQFANSGLFWYLDFADNQIKKSYASSYNTKMNYYPQAAENYLHDFETQMGRVRKQLMVFHNSKDEYVYPDGLKDSLIAWIAIQSVRHPDFAKEIRKHSIVDEIVYISPDENRFFSPLHLSKDLVDKVIAIYRRTLSALGINIAIIDKSCTLTWCLTPKHYICHHNTFFFPLSPYEAVALVPEESYTSPNKMLVGDTIIQGFIHFKNDSEIEPILLSYQKATTEHTNQHLIGLKPCLEKIKFVYDKT